MAFLVSRHANCTLKCPIAAAVPQLPSITCVAVDLVEQPTEQTAALHIAAELGGKSGDLGVSLCGEACAWVRVCMCACDPGVEGGGMRVGEHVCICGRGGKGARCKCCCCCCCVCVSPATACSQ